MGVRHSNPAGGVSSTPQTVRAGCPRAPHVKVWFDPRSIAVVRFAAVTG